MNGAKYCHAVKGTLPPSIQKSVLGSPKKTLAQILTVLIGLLYWRDQYPHLWAELLAEYRIFVVPNLTHKRINEEEWTALVLVYLYNASSSAPRSSCLKTYLHHSGPTAERDEKSLGNDRHVGVYPR